MTDTRATPAQQMLMESCLQRAVPFFWMGPGTLLIARDGLPGVLADVEKLGASVLGLDAFELEGSDVHPRLDLIFDASRHPELANPAAIVEHWPAGLWIDVALRPPS